MRTLTPLSLALLALIACKDPPKPTTAATGDAGPKSVRPATTLPDFDSLVKLDGPDNDAAAPPGAGGPAMAAAGDASKTEGAKAPTPVKLIEPGTEPRSAARYDFPLEKAQTTVATVRMSAEGGGMPPGAGQQPPLKLTLEITPRAKAPDGNVKFTMAVKKAEVVTGGAQVPPEAAKELKAAEAAMASMVGSFSASPRGSLTDVQLGGKGAPPELQELIVPLVELLFAPLPEEPIGVGAKWTLTSGGGNVKDGSMKSTFTMTSRSTDSADITVDTQRSAPPQPVPDPRAPPGTTMQLDGKGKTKMTVRFGGITSKVEGDSKTNVVIKDGSSTPPRSQTQTIVVKHSLVAK